MSSFGTSNNKEQLDAQSARRRFLSGNFQSYERKELVNKIWNSAKESMVVLERGDITPDEREYFLNSLLRYPKWSLSAFFYVPNINIYEEKKLIASMLNGKEENICKFIDAFDNLSNDTINDIIKFTMENQKLSIAYALYHAKYYKLHKHILKQLEPLALMYELSKGEDF